MQLKLDYNYVLSQIIGEHGISVSDIEKLSPQAETAHNRLQQEKNSGKIGFLELPYSDTSFIKEKAKEIKSIFNYFVILGIGGSALGTSAVFQALGNVFQKNLFIADNIDPDMFNELLNNINLSETFFIIVSKSGSTSETIAQFLIIRKILLKNFGEIGYRKRCAIITDPEKGPLRELASKEGILSFSVPPNVGGRFSVLSPVGLFPLAITGIDIDLLLEGALFITHQLEEKDIFKNRAYLFGAINYLFAEKGKNISVLMPYSSKLYGLADWFRQLWAESLGKNGKGSTPVKALGATDQHSQSQLYMEGPKDKLITFLKILQFDTDMEIPNQEVDKSYEYLTGASLDTLINSELDATRVALAQRSVPNMTIQIDKLTPFTIGELIMFFEVATVFTGYLMDIDPFNQPGVELSKHFTYGLMGRKGFEDKREEFLSFFNRAERKYII